MEKIIPTKIKKELKVSDLVHQMSYAGFGARKIGIANKIVKEMFSNENCKVLLQFSSGANYGIQITTDIAESGGSSGAPLEESKSWGKLKEDTKYIDVKCDATIALPLIFSEFIQ